MLPCPMIMSVFCFLIAMRPVLSLQAPSLSAIRHRSKHGRWPERYLEVLSERDEARAQLARERDRANELEADQRAVAALRERVEKAEAECVVWRREADAATHAGLRAQERADKAEAEAAAFRSHILCAGHEDQVPATCVSSAAFGEEGVSNACDECCEHNDGQCVQLSDAGRALLAERYRQASENTVLHTTLARVRQERDRLRDAVAEHEMFRKVNAGLLCDAEAMLAREQEAGIRLREENAALIDEHVRDRKRFENVLVNIYAGVRGDECDPSVSIGMATSAVAQLRREHAATKAALGQAHAVLRAVVAESDRSTPVYGEAHTVLADPEGRAAGKMLAALEREHEAYAQYRRAQLLGVVATSDAFIALEAAHAAVEALRGGK